MKNNKAAGTRRENAAKAILENEGWLVTRGAASLGEADLVALKAGHPSLLVQVKANKGGAYMNFRGPERIALLNAAHKAGARCELWWWPPHGELRRIPASAWPLPIAQNEAAAA